MIYLYAANTHPKGYISYIRQRDSPGVFCRIDQVVALKDTCDYSMKTIHADVEVITQNSILYIIKIVRCFVRNL